MAEGITVTVTEFLMVVGTAMDVVTSSVTSLNMAAKSSCGAEVAWAGEGVGLRSDVVREGAVERVGESAVVRGMVEGVGVRSAVVREETVAGVVTGFSGREEVTVSEETRGRVVLE